MILAHRMAANLSRLAMSPFLCVLAALLLAGTASAQSVDAVPDSNILPLATGNQWALSNLLTRLPSYVTVVSNQELADRRRVRLRIDSPFTSTTLVLAVTPDQILFEGLATGEGRSLFDDPVTLVKNDARTGDVYETSAAKVTVVNAQETVFAPAGIYTDCLHLKLELPSGITQHWYLAPGIGIVRLGNEDFTSFLLNLSNVKPYKVPDRGPRQGKCPVVGIAPNPIASSDFSLPEIEARLNEAMNSGSKFHHLSATWRDLEPSARQYNVSAFRQWLTWADQYGFDVTLTIRTIDTRVVSLPDDLVGKRLDDPEVIQRFEELLSVIYPVITDRVKWVDIANEVDTYFLSKPEDLAPFITFYKAGYSSIKNFRSNLSVGMVFAYNDYRFSDAIFRALNGLCDHVSFTYYPIKSDVRPRDPALARSDIADIVSAAGDRQVIFTEIGYPSSTELGRDAEAQGQFYSGVFDALQSHPDQIAAANFFLMSDIPDSVVRELATYYHLPEEGPFTHFLATLGLHTSDGQAKPAWDVFQRRAPAMNSAQYCSTEGKLINSTLDESFSTRSHKR